MEQEKYSLKQHKARFLSDVFAAVAVRCCCLSSLLSEIHSSTAFPPPTEWERGANPTSHPLHGCTAVDCSSRVTLLVHSCKRNFLITVEWAGHVVRVGCVLTDCLVLKDFWISPVGIFSSQLPYIEERLPINVRNELTDFTVIYHFRTQERRTDWKAVENGFTDNTQSVWELFTL